MYTYRAWFVMPLVLPLFLACTEDEGGGAGGGDDDGGQAAALFEVDGERIIARDDALEQPMLLKRTLRNGPPDAPYNAWNPIMSKVVYFHAQGSTVELRELADPSASPGDSDRVIASFAAEPTDDGVTFAYEPATPVLHVQFAVHDRTEPMPELELPVLEQTIDRAEVTEDHLIIERELTVDASQIAEDAERAPAGIIEAFAPYDPPADFEGRSNGSTVNFYENPPLPGAESSFIHRHDFASPIVFSVSAGTPAARRADLEVAVAYWNRLLEQATGQADRLQLADLPDGVGDFEPGYNVVRWLDGSEGGRGINHTDPFTGRILQTTIYVSPVFETAGADATSVAWGRLQADRGQPVAEPPQELVDRVVSDYYINAFVHELGHGLGLRHQFAGNLSGTVTSDQADALIADYLDGDRADGVLWTSSVMEYVPILQAAMVGDAVRDEDLPYDVAAIGAGYGSSEEEPAELAPYCEAESSEVFADCRENDIGTDGIAGTYWTWEDRLAEISFRNAAAMAAGEPLSDPKTDALVVATLFGDVASQFTAGAEFLVVRAQFPDPLPEEDAAAYAEAVLAHQVDGYAASAGPHLWFLDQVVASGPSEDAATQLVAELRARTEEFAAALDVEVDGAALDAWAASAATELTSLLAPLAEIEFADLEP
jgi:hypothetical protein